MEQFKNLIDPKLLKRAAEGIKRFEEISNDGFVKLASYGWYVDSDISLGYVTGLMEKAINENQEYLDDYFSEYYGTFMKEKMSMMSRKHENRSKIIEEAVYCHQNGKYYASTTLFLSQADGICSGLLFKNRKNKEALKQYIAKNKCANFFSILMIAIENTNTIDSFYSKTNLDDSKLNRHGVMHGLDMDFGREVNSLKAFSLLVFVSDFIDRL
ncbi:MAG: hypothetical protein Q7T12_05935 [Flavobacterium sp.]|nr:hypothetical protein [Flavobacterium sp.]